MMKKFIKIILAFVLILVVGLGFSILTQEKGKWVCEDGEWVKQGDPSEPPPTWGCNQFKKKELKEEENKQGPVGIPFDDFHVPGSQDQRLFPAGFKE